uniref:Nkap_C domain-containing protein n=1 Tax=Heterorhabditis bacteriophora TaxID=37862 RepID=A0A1I7XJF3_HETBA
MFTFIWSVIQHLHSNLLLGHDLVVHFRSLDLTQGQHHLGEKETNVELWKTDMIVWIGDVDPIGGYHGVEVQQGGKIGEDLDLEADRGALAMKGYIYCYTVDFRRSPIRRHQRRRMDSEETEQDRKTKEDEWWKSRRDSRMDVMERGVRSVWSHSPSQKEIEAVYALYQEDEETKLNEEEKGDILKAKRKKEKKKEERKRRIELMKGGESDSTHSSGSEKAKKKKKNKKNKKEKKEKKVKARNSDEESDEWVEVTEKMRVREAEREAREEQEMPGPPIPDVLLARNQLGYKIKANYGKDMLKGEAAAMAAYIARGERIPRRGLVIISISMNYPLTLGEIGLSSAEILEFEKVGYVMSGTRHKAMEATRLRKENQVLTAEEKRLLSGFSYEERKKKEETVLNQFRNLIQSKRTNE